MRTAADIVSFAVGVLIIVTTLSSAVRSTILPRGVQVRLSQIVILGVRMVFRLRVGRSPTYERRDRVMALLGPVALLVQLFAWLLFVLTAYSLMYLASTTRSVARAIELSGSSMFTLGTTTTPHLFANLLSYSEAGLGLLLLTLLITYLPSIYTAFSRRENGVSLLRVRAGNPPKASSMLIRYHRIDDGNMRLAELWTSWEGWFVDIEESHTSFSILAFFRSPQPEQSWINAAGVLLDAAALWLSSIEHPRDPDAQLCIRAGYLSLRRIAELFKVRFDPDPRPDDPITISRSEFDAALAEMADAGLSLKSDRDQAWRDYRGWRVNYDTVLLNLARLVEAPPAPWVSDRSPVQSSVAQTLRAAVGEAVASGSGGAIWRRRTRDS